MHRAFLRFLLTWTRIDLRIARSAPEPNLQNIALLRADEMRWMSALQDWEINHAR
jgi:hypothetical protein